MRNIYTIATDKPSQLYLSDYGKELNLSAYPLRNYTTGQHIYITNSEEIKEGDYWIYISPPEWKDTDRIEVVKNVLPNSWFCKLHDKENYKKVILTTDQDLIKDDVQGINDDFLEWFVRNPSCENVEVNKKSYGFLSGFAHAGYKIIIPKEEPKQETLEETAREYYKRGQLGFEAAADTEEAFLRGAKWQQERSYSEEEVIDILLLSYSSISDRSLAGADLRKWFEQFKKK